MKVKRGLRDIRLRHCVAALPIALVLLELFCNDCVNLSLLACLHLFHDVDRQLLHLLRRHYVQLCIHVT